MQTLQYLQVAISIGFIACIGLYLYLMVVRNRKSKDVDLKIWIVIAVGLCLSIAQQFLGIAQGITTWAKVQINVMVSAALVLFAVWMLYKKLTGKGTNIPQTKQTKKDLRKVDSQKKQGKPKKK